MCPDNTVMVLQNQLWNSVGKLGNVWEGGLLIRRKILILVSWNRQCNVKLLFHLMFLIDTINSKVEKNKLT